MIDADRAIAAMLPTKRWFGGKGRRIASVELVDEIELDEGPPALVLALARVHLGDGTQHLYQVPLHVSERGEVSDAFDQVGTLGVLGSLMAHGETRHGRRGALRFGGPGLDPLAPPGSQSVRAVGSEQSNTSLIFDDAVILKLIRRLETGPNPELELNRFLTTAGFEFIPAQVGEVFYESEGDRDEMALSMDLGIAQQFISDATDGWVHTLESVRALYRAAREGTASDPEASLVDLSATILDHLEDLGYVTAALHATLARGDEFEPGLGAEPVDQGDLKEWADRAHESLRSLVRAGVDGLAPLEDRIEARIDELRTIEDAGSKTRIHGDYHLGQTMLSARGWLLLDFEGEPVKPLDERRAKQSPLRDVAGILRSIGYAASAALFELGEPGSETWEQLQPWAAGWEEAARDRFLTAYLRTSHEGRFLPTDRDATALLLDIFEIDKALYEINYERGHRPDWIRIPLRGIEAVVAGRPRT